MFSLLDEAEGKTKAENLAETVKRAEALRTKVPSLRKYQKACLSAGSSYYGVHFPVPEDFPVLCFFRAFFDAFSFSRALRYLPALRFLYNQHLPFLAGSLAIHRWIQLFL